ncbi:hypothetical protein [Mycoplasma sp. P36-A1]|uniref:hypothetical protein n=1 Tax=Mycoplasma sp. P36-A1 TaxID=3252900 RepID=UPI003C2F45B6
MRISKNTKILFGVLTILILALTFTEVKSVYDATKVTKSTEAEKTSLEIGPYSVSITQSEYEKLIQSELTTALESKKNKDIVNSVTKYFISDYFSLRDKPNFNSVGGTGFVFSKVKKQFTKNAISGYYMDLEQYKNTYGAENLPLVNKVTIVKTTKVNKTKVATSETKTTKVGGVYDVQVKWTYEANEKLSTKSIIKKAKVRLVSNPETKVWYVYDIEAIA